jgi:hypothetical protein
LIICSSFFAHLVRSIPVPPQHGQQGQLDDLETRKHPLALCYFISYIFCVGRTISVRQGRDAPAPSSAAKLPTLKTEQERRPVMNGRPAGNSGLPVHLFNPAFSQFQLALTDPTLILTADDYRNAHKYIKLSSDLYISKPLRQEAILASLKSAIYFDILSITIDGALPDGTIMVPTAEDYVPAGLWELKNEIGAGGSDPSVQGAFSYRKIWAQEKVCRSP